MNCEKEVKPQTVSFTDLKAIKNRVAKLEVLLDEAEQDLEAMRELRYEPEYYQDYRKMEELDAKIDDKHNEILKLIFTKTYCLFFPFHSYFYAF